MVQIHQGPLGKEAMTRSFRAFGILLLAACRAEAPAWQDNAAVGSAQPVKVGGDSLSQRSAVQPRTLAGRAETLPVVPAVPPRPPRAPPAAPPPPNPPPPPPAPTPPPPPPVSPSGSYPNRPSHFTRVVSDYAMNTAPPSGTCADRTIPDGQGWGVVGCITRVNDPSDPVSPPWVMEYTYKAGQGTPIASFNPGKLYHAIPTDVNEIYIAFPVWHDAHFEWNAISNKLMFLMGNNGANWSLTFQSRHNAVHWNMELQANNTAIDYDPNVGPRPNPTGRWVKVEVLYKLGASGYYKLFVDGALVSNFTNTNFPTGPNEILLDGTWGGGSGPSRRTSTRRIGHILIAHP